MSREQSIERLRVWAARANHEAQEADTRADIMNWQGQAAVLGGVASFLAGQGQGLDDFTVWRQVALDRQKALAEWMVRRGGPEAAYYAGQVAGYDVAMTALRDVAGRTWPRIEPHVG